MRLLLALALLTAAAAIAQQPVVVTQQDLIEMTESDLPTSLIVKTVRAADRVPVLGPQDLISLTRLGVASEVLEAVVERAGTMPRPSVDPMPRDARTPQPAPSQPEPEPEREPTPAEPDPAAPAPADAAPDEAPRNRFRLTAAMAARRGWGRKPFSTDKRPFAVYWALTALDDQGKPTPLAGCPREPVCWCGDPIGRKRCAQPGNPEWGAYLSCLRPTEMVPGESVDLFDIEVPGEVRELRAVPFVGVLEKDDSMYLEPWTSDSVGPAYVSVRPEPGQTYEATVEAELSSGRKPNFTLARESFRLADPTERPPADAISLRPAAGVDLTPGNLQACEIE